jgi:hypothetical protein
MMALSLQAAEQYDFFVDASFTYWYVAEEGLKIASDGVLNGSELSSPIDTNHYFPSFQYTPGFKVGIGLLANEKWEYRADYTWVYSNVHTSGLQQANGGDIPAGSLITSPGEPVFVVNKWFDQLSSTDQLVAATSLSAHWNVHINLIDVTGSRPLYEGKRFTFSPKGGLEAALISQHLNLSVTQALTQFPAIPPQPIHSYNQSQSWGIGPILGATSTQRLPCSFYLEEGGAFSLLYTTYTSIKHTEDPTSSDFNPGPYTSSIKNYYAIRPNAFLDLGIGWKNHCKRSNRQLDISLSYEFALYWAQNLMAPLLQRFPNAADNLFTQGLTFNAMLTF